MGDSSSSVTTLYSCIVCGAAYSKQQSLAAHMRVHKDVEFEDFHVRIVKDVKDDFMALCKKHKTTSCHLIYALMKMAVQGEKMGVVDLGAKNPLIIQMISNFQGAPRGRNKYQLPAGPWDPLSRALFCAHLSQKEWSPGHLGWCRRVGRWVTPTICQGCVEDKKDAPADFITR